jgi:hypothetical protein
MEMVGAGIASLAFWGFMAAAVIVGVWEKTKKRDAQHETLRRMLESNKPVDEALMAKLMGAEPQRPDRDLGIGAIIVFAVAIGLVVLAAALNGVAPKSFMPIVGAAGLCACIAGGLKVASGYVRRTRLEDEAQTRRGPTTG